VNKHFNKVVALCCITGFAYWLVQSAPTLSDRSNPLRIFEAIEATNVAITFWGKVVDQDGRSVSGATVQYDYTIEHGNLAGVAWSEQEVRTGETVSDKDGLFSVLGLKGHALGSGQMGSRLNILTIASDWMQTLPWRAPCA
jgi:hypothetical protein